MLILVSHLIDRPVITFDEAEPIGVLKDPIIDSTNGKLIGYFVGHGFFRLKQDVLAADDITGYDENRIIVHNYDVIRNVEEEPKIREILNRKIPVLSAKVLTESGRNLGRAQDLLLDTELNMIVKYYVHGVMHDRVIAAEHVISIDKRGIMVDDTAPSAAAAPVEAS